MDFKSELKKMVNLLFLAVTVFRVEASTNTSHEHVLRQFLLTDYDKNVRPVVDPRTAIEVELGIDLSKLVKVDNKQQLMTTSLWFRQVWKNPFLRWEPSKFGNITRILVSPVDIWVPDTVLYNNGDESISLAGHLNKFQTSVIVKYDGTNTWMSPATLTSTCAIDARLWPFDLQKCSMTFGSWTMNRNLLILNAAKKKKSNRYADAFVTNGDWSILRLRLERNEHLYSCCENTFSDITFSIIMRRKPLYYILYLIVPCFFLSLLTLAGFQIPIESGERIGFNVTILLGLSVYLLLIAGYLPETSDEVPLLGVYFILNIAGVALAVLGTVVVLKLHFGKWNPCQKRRAKSKKKCGPLDGSAVNQAVEDSGNLEMQSCHSELNEAKRDGGNERDGEGHETRAAEEFAAKVDRVFFWMFLVYVIVCFVAVYGNASARDNFD